MERLPAPRSPRRGAIQSWPSSISIGPSSAAARRRRGSSSSCRDSAPPKRMGRVEKSSKERKSVNKNPKLSSQLGVLKIWASGQGPQHRVRAINAFGEVPKAPRPLQGLVGGRLQPGASNRQRARGTFSTRVLLKGSTFTRALFCEDITACPAIPKSYKA